MPNINNRIFGAPMDKHVENKLKARQYLAGTGGVTVEDIETLKSSHPLFGAAVEEYEFETEFGTEIDLGSRTPFARMWTAVEWSTIIDRQEKIQKPSSLQENEAWDPYNMEVIKYGNNEALIYEVNTSSGNVHLFGASVTVGGGYGSLYPELLPGFDTENMFNKPPAGITSVKSETEGAIGAVKKTSIEFVVHNFWDYDKIYSRYFLRPGALIFIDFGWSMVLDELYDPYCIINDSYCPDNMAGWSSEEKLYANNSDKQGYVSLSKGDYETAMGMVINYDAKIRPDGGVDCSIEIMSKNVLLLENNITQKIKKKLSYDLDMEIIKFMATAWGDSKDPALKAKAGALLNADVNVSPESKAAWKIVYSIFAKGASMRGSTYRNTPGPSSLLLGIFYNGTTYNSKKLYITFGLFEDLILNTEFGFGKTLNDILSKNNMGGNFESKFDSSNSWAQYHYDLFLRQQAAGDSDDLSFILPVSWHTGETYTTGVGKMPDRIENEGLTQEQIDGGYTLGDTGADYKFNRIPLREIFISVDLIKQAIDVSSNVGKLIKFVLKDLNKNSLDIYDFQISNNKSDNQLSIIDRNYIHSNSSVSREDTFNNMFTFNVQSDDSLVQEYDISFSTPQGSFQNMVAIQAMAGGTTIFPFDSSIDVALAMKGLDNAYDWNNMSFRYLPAVGAYSASNIDETESFSSTLMEFYKDLEVDITVNENYKSYLDTIGQQDMIVNDEILSKAQSLSAPIVIPSGTTPEFDDAFDAKTEERESNVKVVDSMADYYLYKAKNDYYIDNVPTVLPINLNLKIYGISGITPGDIFKVSYLPMRYRHLIYFQVIKVTQSVDEIWSTSIETVMRRNKLYNQNLGNYRKYEKMVLNKSVLTNGSPLKLSSYGTSYNIKSLMKHLTVEIPRSMYGHIDFIFSFEATKAQKIDSYIKYEDVKNDNAHPFIKIPNTKDDFDTKVMHGSNDPRDYSIDASSPPQAKFSLKNKTFENRLKAVNSKYQNFTIMYWPYPLYKTTSSSRGGVGYGKVGDLSEATHGMFGYYIKLIKSKQYKLLVKGKLWMIVPGEFEELAMINQLFKLMAGGGGPKTLKDDPKCAECSNCDNFLGWCTEEICNDKGGFCVFNKTPGLLVNNECLPHPDVCFEEI